MRCALVTGVQTCALPIYPATQDYQYVNHIMFGGMSQVDYINPYADMVRGYQEYSRSLMLAQFEIKQDFSFLTEGLSFRAMGNTNRSSYFDVARAYKPFFYQATSYNRLDDTYDLQILNELTSSEEHTTKLQSILRISYDVF